MNIHKMLENMMQYFTEAFTRIFGPSTDEYPEVGVQPFEGETNTVKSDEAQGFLESFLVLIAWSLDLSGWGFE